MFNAGGSALSSLLYPFIGAMADGQCLRVELTVRFEENTVRATANGDAAASLPINLTGDPKRFRISYRGTGAGNTNVMLIDEPNVTELPPNAATFWNTYA